jgi:hypothetical protein
LLLAFPLALSQPSPLSLTTLELPGP